MDGSGLKSSVALEEVDCGVDDFVEGWPKRPRETLALTVWNAAKRETKEHSSADSTLIEGGAQIDGVVGRAESGEDVKGEGSHVSTEGMRRGKEMPRRGSQDSMSVWIEIKRNWEVVSFLDATSHLYKRVCP